MDDPGNMAVRVRWMISISLLSVLSLLPFSPAVKAQVHPTDVRPYRSNDKDMERLFRIGEILKAKGTICNSSQCPIITCAKVRSISSDLNRSVDILFRLRRHVRNHRDRLFKQYIISLKISKGVSKASERAKFALFWQETLQATSQLIIDAASLHSLFEKLGDARKSAAGTEARRVLGVYIAKNRRLLEYTHDALDHVRKFIGYFEKAGYKRQATQAQRMKDVLIRINMFVKSVRDLEAALDDWNKQWEAYRKHKLFGRANDLKEGRKMASKARASLLKIVHRVLNQIVEIQKAERKARIVSLDATAKQVDAAAAAEFRALQRIRQRYQAVLKAEMSLRRARAAIIPCVSRHCPAQHTERSGARALPPSVEKINAEVDKVSKKLASSVPALNIALGQIPTLDGMKNIVEVEERSSVTYFLPACVRPEGRIYLQSISPKQAKIRTLPIVALPRGILRFRAPKAPGRYRIVVQKQQGANSYAASDLEVVDPAMSGCMPRKLADTRAKDLDRLYKDLKARLDRLAAKYNPLDHLLKKKFREAGLVHPGVYRSIRGMSHRQQWSYSYTIYMNRILSSFFFLRVWARENRVADHKELLRYNGIYKNLIHMMSKVTKIYDTCVIPRLINAARSNERGFNNQGKNPKASAAYFRLGDKFEKQANVCSHRDVAALVPKDFPSRRIPPFRKPCK